MEGKKGSVRFKPGIFGKELTHVANLRVVVNCNMASMAITILSFT